MASSKKRLDLIIFEKGYFDSREKARIAIMEGKVIVNGQKEDKPGTIVKGDAIITIKDDKLKYVSRGGYKLEKAINIFNIDLNDKVCIDIGSSTGGFTDCMLKNGAKKVFAVDCGTNQLDYGLRTNEKVKVMENTNARYLTYDDINEKVDFITADVSFISLKHIIPVVKNLLKDNGESVMLIKPQFEAGKDKVLKHGIIKDKNVHEEVINKVINFCNDENLFVYNVSFSPIKGPAGNIEYLIYIGKIDNLNLFNEKKVSSIVEESHNELEK